MQKAWIGIAAALAISGMAVAAEKGERPRPRRDADGPTLTERLVTKPERTPTAAPGTAPVERPPRDDDTSTASVHTFEKPQPTAPKAPVNEVRPQRGGIERPSGPVIEATVPSPTKPRIERQPHGGVTTRPPRDREPEIGHQVRPPRDRGPEIGHQVRKPPTTRPPRHNDSSNASMSTFEKPHGTPPKDPVNEVRPQRGGIERPSGPVIEATVPSRTKPRIERQPNGSVTTRPPRDRDPEIGHQVRPPRDRDPEIGHQVRPPRDRGTPDMEPAVYRPGRGGPSVTTSERAPGTSSHNGVTKPIRTPSSGSASADRSERPSRTPSQDRYEPGCDPCGDAWPVAPYAPSTRRNATTPRSGATRRTVPGADPLPRWTVQAGITALHSAYHHVNGGIADPWSDPGLGLALEYRPVPALGVEAGLIRYVDILGAEHERAVRPYALAGLTWQGRNVHDAYFDGEASGLYVNERAAWGPHAGIGVEFGLGRRWVIDLEGRVIGYLNHSGIDPSLPGALQTTLAVGHRF
ncbi:MAG: hypothetical protein JRI25_28775 [Deltaproteobacteria bacterium]|nr:hypothetical protein [Deltaproteobacteria bacterium]